MTKVFNRQITVSRDTFGEALALVTITRLSLTAHIEEDLG